MIVVDAHQHYWDTAAVRNERLERIPELRGRFLPEQLASTAPPDIAASVCVEAASAGADGRSETEWLLRAIRTARIPTRIVAWAPVGTEAAAAYIEWLRNVLGLVLAGIRQGFEHGAADLICSKQVVKGVRSVGAAGLPFDVVVRQEMLPHVRVLAGNCPETTLVLNHMGKPRVSGTPSTSWCRDLEALAANSNVLCKISGLMTEADSTVLNPQTYSQYIQHAIDVFGWDRIMFGSDWPVCTLAASYGQWLNIVERSVSKESPSNQDKLFASNAIRVYFGDSLAR